MLNFNTLINYLYRLLAIQILKIDQMHTPTSSNQIRYKTLRVFKNLY